MSHIKRFDHVGLTVADIDVVTRPRAGLARRHGQRTGIAQPGLRGRRPASGCRLGSYRGLRTGRWHRRVRGRVADGLRPGPEGIIVSLAERIG